MENTNNHSPSDILGLFPLSTTCSAEGNLSIAGHRLSDLAQEWCTPLYIYDGTTVRHQVETLHTALKNVYPGESEITYAAKAYFAPRFARYLAGLGVGVDVVSLGELQIAASSGFSPGKIHLHGNNKSEAELRAALKLGIQAIVVDSLDELDFLEQIVRSESFAPATIWLRVTPGVDVDTHAYRQTGHHATKFGLPLNDGQAAEAIQRAKRSRWLNLTGLHMHLGSLLFDVEPYIEAVHLLYAFARQEDFIPLELSPGGGWGVRYLPGDPAKDISDWVSGVAQAVQEECHDWPLPKLILEPGRWLVAQAGVALYTVGACKTSGDGSHWAAVDGGMADNLRPALYGAPYAALLPERVMAEPKQRVNIVGKFCESGDFLIKDAYLPEIRRGDLLAIPVAGAYHLSLASNYNMASRPAALWLEPGSVEVLQPHEVLSSAPWLYP